MRGEPYAQKREILKPTFGFENRPAKKSFMKLVDFSSGVFFARYRSASSLALGTLAQNLDFLFCGESPQECGKIFGCRRGGFSFSQFVALCCVRLGSPSSISEFEAA